MTQHTPGPWGVAYTGIGDPDYITEFPDGDGRRLAELIDQPCYDSLGTAYYPDGEFEANAQLIAAAPELLEALNFALQTIEYREGLKHRMDLFTADERARLRRAIDKATGQ